MPSALLNDGEIYGCGGGGVLWGSRGGPQTALSSSFASSCETTPLKGEAISAAAAAADTVAATAATAADIANTAALESDDPDAADDVIAAAATVGRGYWRTPGIYGISHNYCSGGERGAEEDTAGIARNFPKTGGPLDLDVDGRQASERPKEPPASTLAVTATVTANICLDGEGSTRIADASSSELEEELRRVRSALANRVWVGS